MKEEQLKAIEEKAAHATPGPWRNDERAVVYEMSKAERQIYGVADDDARPMSILGLDAEGTYVFHRNEDAEFVVSARESVPALIEEVRALKAALAEAMFHRRIVERTESDSDPAGATYDLEFTPKIQKWAEMAEVDLKKLNPFYHGFR